MDTDKITRDHVIALLNGKQAHMTFDDAVADFPPALINTNPPNVSYTCWHLIEHLRITQLDILEYIRDPKYVSPEWPKGYWPSPDAQADLAIWNETIRRFRSDLAAMIAIVADPNTDLYQPIPHGYGGHTVLREALLTADHNAYHIGELGILRQIMGVWGQR